MVIIKKKMICENMVPFYVIKDVRKAAKLR